MCDSVYSSMRSSHSSLLESLDISSQLADLSSLLADYDMLPPARRQPRRKGPAPLPPARPSKLGKLSKSSHSLNLIVNSDSGCESSDTAANTMSWKDKADDSDISADRPWNNGIIPKSPVLHSSLNRKKYHSELNLSRIDDSADESKFENPWSSFFVPRSERKMGLGNFSKSQIILRDIDIEGDCDQTLSDEDSGNKVDDEEKEVQQPGKWNENMNDLQIEFPKLDLEHQTHNTENHKLASISCFGKVGNRVATRMFLPPAMPPENERQKVKEMQERKAKEKKERMEKEAHEKAEKEKEEQRLEAIKAHQLKEAEEKRKAKLEAEQLANKIAKEKEAERDREILKLREQEHEVKRLEEIEERKIKMQMEEAQRVKKKEEDRAQEQQKLKEMESHITQLTKMVSQFSTIKQAKELAHEQGIKSLKNHTSEIVREIYKREQQLTDDLNAKHKKDMAQVEETYEELNAQLEDLKNSLATAQTGLNLDMLNLSGVNHRDSGYEESEYSTIGEVEKWSKDKNTQSVENNLNKMLAEVPNILWSQRTVTRFVSTEKVPSLGTFQECYMSEDYNKVSKCKAYIQEDTSRNLSWNNLHEAADAELDLGGLKRKSDSPDTPRRRAQSMMVLRNQQMSPVPTEHSLPNKPEYLHLKLRYSLKQKGSHPGAIHNPVDACFLPTGNLLIAELDNSRLQEFDVEGNSVQLFNSVPFRPCGMAMTKEGYIATTDSTDKNIKVFTRGGDLVCKFGTGYFKDPSTVSVTNNDLYIINENIGPWQHFMFQYNAMTGVKTKIGYDDRDMYVINNPEYSCIDENTGNIYISDSGLHCVWVFDKNLKYLFKFGELGNGDGEMSHPSGVCCDNNGHVFVADCANHRIVMYTSKGEFVRQILGQDHGLNYPQVVQVNTQGHFVVVQNSEVILFES